MLLLVCGTPVRNPILKLISNGTSKNMKRMSKISNGVEYLSFNKNKRRQVREKIKQTLLARKEIVFAFIFGSFLDSPSFRDIDIGIYLKSIKKEDIFDYELNLAEKIAQKCNLAFDIVEIKVLNFAPNSFLNNIFSRGQLLFCKNHQLLSDMIENTSLDALVNEYIAHQSLKELVPD